MTMDKQNVFRLDEPNEIRLTQLQYLEGENISRHPEQLTGPILQKKGPVGGSGYLIFPGC